VYDLVISGGRVIDPAQGLDGRYDVAFRDGKVAEVAPSIERARAVETVAADGALVVPGLIDLHTHVYWGATSLSVRPEPVARRSGATTLVDAGSAGAGNFHGFREFVIEPSPVRILPYLNVSFPGIFAFSKTVMVGESADMRLIDPREAVRVVREHKDLILGIKVRVGKSASGNSGAQPMFMALDVAEETGLPVMAHLDNPPPARHEVVSRLRAGDILTHCFRPFPNAPVRADGRVRDEILAARERGVIFDIGHGGGSFGFGTTRAMLAAGFLPDVISSDVHAISIEGPAIDLLTTMSKFLCLGVDLATVIKLATVGPAAAIRRPDLGTLKPGSIGEASILELKQGTFDYVDCIGEYLTGDRRLLSTGVVLGGKWWHPT
jgi:dihydroorotase